MLTQTLRGLERDGSSTASEQNYDSIALGAVGVRRPHVR
jgi:hypothetical protein